jgi:type VI secretion system protein ImpA
MPLRNDLLNPISADNPTGPNLRYDPLYDKIKDARREDLDAPQGEWKRERKLADWPLVIKLINDALATKTKDLQLAVWLAQALLRREGIASFKEGLDLVLQLLETYWDNIYPEIEDGDLELRVAPLEWISTESDRELDRPASAIKLVPMTESGLTWVQFDETRQVGSEESVADSYDKQAARTRKIEEGKTPPEVFDKAFESTPKVFYVELEQTFDGTLASLKQLSVFCDEKFGDISPSFGDLRKVLEDVRTTVHVLLVRKREKEPDADAPVVDASPAASAAPSDAGAANASLPAVQRSVWAQGSGQPGVALAPLPGSWDDAVSRIISAAKFMRQQDPSSPAPYLMLRGLRWGELRAFGQDINPSSLVPPPQEVRQSLRRAAMDMKWADVLEMGETVMGMECGRGWLDLQRYVVRACQELGGFYAPVARAIVAELGALLETFPQLPEMTMMDDMPTANADTLAWIKRQPFRHLASAGPPSESASLPGSTSRTFELAMLAASSGRPEVCNELLAREIAQEPSGRGRFQRRLQIARLCQSAGNDSIAIAVLQEAATEIEQKHLEDWESREMLAGALGLLYRCPGVRVDLPVRSRRSHEAG